MSSLHPIFTTHILTVPYLYSICLPCTPHILQPISKQYLFFILNFQLVCTHFTVHAQTVPHLYITSKNSIPFIISSEHIFHLYSTQHDSTPSLQAMSRMRLISTPLLSPVYTPCPVYILYLQLMTWQFPITTYIVKRKCFDHLIFIINAFQTPKNVYIDTKTILLTALEPKL